MKKLISLVCTASIMASALVSAASAANLSDDTQTIRYSTEIAGNLADVEYRLESGEVVYANVTAGDDVAERIGDVIYINGEKVATIHEESINYEEETVLPYTGWMKQDSCLYGTVPAEYTKPISDKNRNIEFENAIIKTTVKVIGMVLAAAFPVTGEFTKLANKIVDVAIAIGNTQYKTLYFHEVIKGHKTLPSMWQQVYCEYYFNSSHSVHCCNDTYYRAWG